MNCQKTIIPVIPYPKKVRFEGEYIRFVNRINVVAADYMPQINAFSDILARLYGVDLQIGQGGISLLTDSSLQAGHYILSCRENVILRFSDSGALGFGFATLLQLLEQDEHGLRLPKVEIDDYPDRDYRGLMIDLARQRHSVDVLYRYIDLCYLYKVNYLHLHFTDDCAYTLPSILFPAVNDAQGWCYSSGQLRLLNEYAVAHGVTIVPEIEIPGHAQFLVANSRGKFGDAPHQKTMCCAKLESANLLLGMIKEICKLFPDTPFIHIGGDEVNTSEWELCPLCQAFCKDHSLASTGELYSYLVGQAARAVLSLGKRPIVWEGFPKEGSKWVPTKTIVCVFESLYHLPHDLLEEGYDILNTSWKPLYITQERWWHADDVYAWNIFRFGNWFSYSEAYPDPIQVEETPRVLGAQICAWESASSHEFPLLMESLPAMSERVWTLPDLFGTYEFQKRLMRLKKVANNLWM
jgi:hexosaminidase